MSEPSTELVRRETTTLAEKMQWAKAMSTATMLPKQYQRNPGNLLYALEYADALGVSRINALTSIHVIEGKPSASADLIAGMVRRAGHRLRLVGDETFAEAHLIRADDPEFTYKARWDLDKARAAGLLGKGVWKAYPAAMLRARAITEVARMGASDALFGCIYTPEELGAEVDDEGDVVHSITTVRSTEASGAEAAADEALPVRGDGPSAPEPLLLDTSSKLAKAMYAAINGLGIADDERMPFIVSVIDRPIESTKAMTEDEARAVLRHIDEINEPDETVDAEVVES